MKPLKRMQQILTWLCIYPSEKKIGKWRKFIYVAGTSFMVIGTLAASVLAGLGFIWKFIAIDFDSSLDAVYVVVGFLPLINSFIMMMHFNHYIVAIFDGLRNIYAKRIEKGDGSIDILIKLDEKCELAAQFYFKYAIFWPGVSTVASFLLPVLFVVLTHQPFNRDDLYMPYKLLLPWNQYTPMGYFAESIFIILTNQIYFVFNGALILLFVSLCLQYQAFGQIFQYLLEKFQKNSGENRINDRKILYDAMNFQSSVRCLFFVSTDIFQIIITGYLLFMVAIPCIVYELDWKIHNPDSEFVQLIIAANIGFGNLFLFCYFGNMATESFENMADTAYNLNWYELEIDSLKYLIPIMHLAQRPLTYDGYIILTLNLETYTQLIKSIYSYYMFLKTF